MRWWRWLLLLGLISGKGSGALAQQLPIFEAGIAGGGGSLPAYPASDQNFWRGIVVPYLVYRGEVLRADDRGVRTRTGWGNGIAFNLSASAAFNGTSRSIAARRGMPDLDWLGEVGPTLLFTLWRWDKADEAQRITLDTPLRAVFSTDWSSLSFRGFTFAPEIAYEQVNLHSPRTRLRLSGGVTFATDRYADYFYGVEPRYATPDRPAYAARAGYMGARLSLAYRVPLSDRLSVIAGGRIENFSAAANADSPLFRRHWNITAAIGFAFALYASDARIDGRLDPFD